MMDYTVWNNEPTELSEGTVIQDFAEYSGKPIPEIVEHIHNFKKYTSKDYHELGEVNFYNKSENYIYDILGANWLVWGPANKMHKFLPGSMKLIREFPITTFLEFGGGIGVFCQIIKEMKPDSTVIHMDIPGPLMEFARWRYNKYNLPIVIQEISTDDFTIQDTVDFIFSDAVFEHLPTEQQERYITKLAKSLNLYGFIYLIIDLSGVNVDMPMHYNVNIEKLHTILTDTGLSCMIGHNSFASIWQNQQVEK